MAERTEMLNNSPDGLENDGRFRQATTVADESASTVERQRDEYLDLLQRTQAEFANYQKRAERDFTRELRYAVGPLARELTGILDSLQQATDAARQQADDSPLARGVGIVQAQLLEALARHGVRQIDALGHAFDPHQHEAVIQQPSADAAPGTIVQVLQPGYQLHERVLRPARVAVAGAQYESPPD